jgi:hypothetical protein
MAGSFRVLSSLTLIAFIFLPASGSAADKALDPCALLTQVEIQAVLGKPVQAGQLKTQSNPASGANCSFVVADFGSLNILIKPLSSYENPEKIKAEFARMKMAPVDLPGVGDRSFFTSPGYTMTQLHTFKGSKYILFTMLVPGSTEAVQKVAAEKLMRKLLPRLEK